MDIKQLLEKMDQFAGQAVGQKPGDQWKGTDKAPPGKKLVGDSILKDLSKGKTPKSKEQELSEEFEAFLQSLEEENLGTHPKRPGRTSDRHARGHEPLPRYKTVKEIDAPEIEFQKQQALRKHEDETAEVGMFTGAETGFGALSAARSARKRAKAKDDDEIDESAMSEKDIELQDYRSMTDKEFQTAYGMSKTEWINKNKSLVIQNPSIKKALGLDEAGSPAQQAAIAIAMKKAGKKPKNESAEQEYTVIIDRKGREKPVSGTIPELLQYFGYTLEVGKSYEHERGRYKINMNPKNVVQLVDALNKAATNAAANSSPSTYYSVGEGQVVEGVAYKAANPHPASKDPIVAKVLKQMRPGLTGLDMNNEAFLYFAYEIGKMRAREMWEDYGPAIKHFYQSGIGVNEGWESGPEEYEEPYDDADDAYDRQRQEKIDTEAEKEWAKLPKVSTYKLVGRGPNMEPNYEFGDEFDSLEKALKYREEIMKDPKTPHPEHIGIRTITKLANQTNEMADTRQTPLVDKEDYDAKRAQLQKIQMDPDTAKDPQLKAELARRMHVLMQQAKAMGIDESRAHKVLSTWFKNRELQDKFAKGELTVPTPQERKDKVEKPKKQVKEYGANQPQGTAGQTALSKPNPTDPKQAQAIAQATSALKSATQSSAPAPMIAKALDAASQGKPVGGQDMKAIEPLMKDMATVAQDPKLASQFRTLAQQIQQAQKKTT